MAFSLRQVIFGLQSLFFLAAALVAGCAQGPTRYPVEGTVIFADGGAAKELAGGTVSFESEQDQSNVQGEIQADGSFRLASPEGAEGVPAGRYRVLVLPPEPADPDNRPPAVIRENYHSYVHSGIVVTVEERVNHFLIRVQRATP